ncbi:MAG: PAS domain-containing protein [Bacteroidia bacterium]|nr:PAS domain-containing protein [Bacteroidia bacterium]MDW8015814.1 PAS domain-containing protein [Bacteroidia bacterium]
MASFFSPQELSRFLSEIAAHLAQYEAMEASLRERLSSLEREFGDRMRIVDRFALISETDTRGVITYANPKFCEVSGYSLSELLNKPHNIIRHPDMPREVFKDLWETIKAGKIWQGEIKNRRKDGSAYWVLSTIGPLLDADGVPYRYVSMRVDITSQKELEQKLRLERDQLAHELYEDLQWAQSIQTALLSQANLDEGTLRISLPYFLIWKPLQLVSGDFVWAMEEKGRILIFVGDSVGHGLAGGLISTLFLQEIYHQVMERGIWRPEQLAEELDERLGYLFRHKFPLPITVDGTLLLIDRLRMKMEYVAMGGKGGIVRNGQFIPFERYRFSFGDLLGHTVQEETLFLEEGDQIYLYSDGIADQLNPEGKKFGHRRLEEMLIQMAKFPLTDRKEEGERILKEWRADAPQADDIILLGIEISNEPLVDSNSQ